MSKEKKIPKFYLKDRLFHKDNVTRIAREIRNVYKDFDSNNFINDVMDKFGDLELKQRITHISDMLYKYLPSSYERSVKIIIKALPDELDKNQSDGDYGDFIYAGYSHFVQAYGLDKKHLQISLLALEEITKRFSAEYAIRHFINNHQDITLDKMLEWSKNDNYHVRRLASEGSRPRLPWGIKTSLVYTQTEAILDNLYYDSKRYVTRSVANHLNDISKIDQAFVIQKLTEWEKSGTQTLKEMEFIKNHSLRTLRRKAKKLYA